MKVFSASLGLALLSGAFTSVALLPTPAYAQDLASIDGAQVGTAADVTVVHIQVGSGTPSASVFRQSNPERLVVDIAGATLGSGVEASVGGIVTRAEFSSFNDGTDNVRLTLSLSGPANYELKNDAGAIVLTLRPGAVSDPLSSAEPTSAPADGVRLSGPAAQPEGARLTTLDFQQKERVSRVLLGLQAVEAEITQPERNLIAIDLPGATMPESLRREIDTQFFYSAVDSVRAYPTRAGVRVAVRLRAGAEYAVKKEGGLTVVEVQVPADQIAARETAVQRSSAAAPSTPATNGGDGLKNSQSSELMIDASGRTVDPQAKYGSGGGSRANQSALCYTGDASASARRFTGRRMSIDLQDADIHTVFRFFADFGDVNIVTSDDVAGKVTVRLKDIPWDEGLSAVLQSKSLAAQCLGNIIRVASIETVKAEQMAALDAKKANDELVELALYVAPLNYAQADELEDQVKALVSARGSVQVDTRGNQLIIRDTESNLAQIRELLRHVDLPNRQVSIDARFVEANTNFVRALGVQWGGGLDASGATGYPTGVFFPNTIGASGGISRTISGQSAFYDPGAQSLLVDLGSPAAANSAIAFNLGTIPGLFNIDARLSAAVTEGWGKVISSPRVTALDNEEASVTQGARIPYLSTSQNGTNVQFIEADLELTVTPHITSDNTVFLDISITNDRPDYNITAQGQPAIAQKEIATRVLVPDGDTTVLGGVYQTSESFSTSRVPLLGDIPILGYLFKNSTRNRTQSEMLVFITPHIIPVETGK